MLIYEAHYKILDANQFYLAANSTSYEWTWFTLGSGSWNMERLVWLQLQIFGTSYHAVKVTFAFMGLMGTYFFYRAASIYLNRDAQGYLVLLGFVPSIVFWSSTLGKDPVIFLALGVYAYGAATWDRRRGWHGWSWLVSGIIVASYVRLWMAMIMVGALLILVLLTAEKRWHKIVIVLVSAVVVAVLGVRLMGRLGVESIDTLLPKLTEVVHGLSQGGSAQTLDDDFLTLRDVVIFLPRGAFSALFRPLPWEAHNLFMFAAGVESLILFGFVGISLLKLHITRLRNPLVLWALAYLGVWIILYSFLSYGNLGAGFRFRLQAMPFIIALSLELGWRKGTMKYKPGKD